MTARDEAIKLTKKDGGTTQSRIRYKDEYEENEGKCELLVCLTSSERSESVEEYTSRTKD